MAFLSPQWLTQQQEGDRLTVSMGSRLSICDPQSSLPQMGGTPGLSGCLLNSKNTSGNLFRRISHQKLQPRMMQKPSKIYKHSLPGTPTLLYHAGFTLRNYAMMKHVKSPQCILLQNSPLFPAG